MKPGEVRARCEIRIGGLVQGVGFRPWVYRRARELGVSGFVRNNGGGVIIEAEGASDALDALLHALNAEPPPLSHPEDVRVQPLPPRGETHFVIKESAPTGEGAPGISPDIATCPACLEEMRDPSRRRYRYPFTNCTQCGPRYSILLRTPYDRPNTSMRAFSFCAACKVEYEDPADRRFHAQPIACPACGPHVWMEDDCGRTTAERDDALLAAAAALRSGKILALKGLGGFHLMVNARDPEAIARLRLRKHRPHKPLAVMYPDLACASAELELDPVERALLESAEAPIVVARRRLHGPAEQLLSPDTDTLGVFLPYTPLHHLLLDAVGGPLVATSGNRAEDPLCTDNDEARAQLHGIADLFLLHNRPIVRPVDDSLLRVVMNRPMLLRRARGFVPAPIDLHRDGPDLISLGGLLKNTVAIARGPLVILSQHLGDLESAAAHENFVHACADIAALEEARPETAACDLHPDYASTRHAESLGLPVLHTQHHAAHGWAVMAEHALTGPVLAVAWDGTGFGPDGTVWGGEFLRMTPDAWLRVAALRPFRLPGGDAAARAPRRCAAGVLHAMGRALPSADNLLNTMLDTGLNAPWTTSAGRLFDAVAALLEEHAGMSYEGQAAMRLEAMAARADSAYPLKCPVRERGDLFELDWAPLVDALISARDQGIGSATLARGFHEALAEGIAAIALRADLGDVVLGGGCFQNAILLESTVHRLRAQGFRVHWAQRVPTNDGGLSLGQAFHARWAAAPVS